MDRGVWALRAIELAFTSVLVAAALAFAHTGICAQACHDFATWWSAQTSDMLAIQIYEITIEAPRLGRGDLPLTPDALTHIDAADSPLGTAPQEMP